MLASAKLHRRSGSVRKSCCLIDALESRQLLSGETVQTPLPAVLANIANPTANNITLNRYFNDATLPGTLVTFQTTEGQIQVGLTDAATPQTVANFLSYVSSNAYNSTFFHRSVDLNTGLGGSPEAPATIIQGGGYEVSNGSLTHIPTGSPVADEYTTELYGDVAGTLAMAKTSDANSATSEFYFNVTDNTELDTPTVDANGVTTSYTVFGQVLSGSSTISTIAALPTANLGSGLDTVPVSGLTEQQIAAGNGVTESNLVFTNTITSEAGTSYTVSSDNSALVKPTVTDGVLSFAYSSTLFGTAEISITAKNLDGTSTSTTMEVTVPNPATPTAGPVGVNYTAPFVQTGNTGNFSVLSGDTDSLSPFNLGSLTIVTPPTNGTATVDATTGHINYTPNAGYTGADSLSYTIADSLGNVSNVTTVSLSVVPGPVQLTIGTSKATSLVYTDPSGIVATVTVGGGTADITFTDYRVTLKTINGVVHASGAGAAITHITMNNKGIAGTMNIKANGPITIGSFYTIEMKSFTAPTATITGDSTFGGIGKLTLAAANNATITLGKVLASGLDIDSVSNTSLTALAPILYIKSKQWVNTDQGSYSINGINILDLEVPGVFADSLNLSAQGYSLYKANVGTPSAAWSLTGSLAKATLGTPGTGWSLVANGIISSLAIKGNLANNMQAGAIGTLTVSGTTTGSTLQTDGTFNKKVNQIGKIAFGGAVSSTVVFSVGNIGAISAPSLTDSRIYAGVQITVAENGKLAAASTDVTSDARISSVTLGKGANAFADALITADILGALKLGKVSTANNGTVEGVAAHQYGSISATFGKSAFNAGAGQLKTAKTLTAYETLKKILSTDLGDFTVNFF